MHHRFDDYRRDHVSPDLIGNLPEIRHLRSLEMHLGSRTRWQEDPFLSPRFENVVAGQFDGVSHRELVDDWIRQWVLSSRRHDQSAAFPAAFLGDLKRGGALIGVEASLFFDFEGVNGGTCVRVIAPCFTRVLLERGP